MDSDAAQTVGESVPVAPPKRVTLVDQLDDEIREADAAAELAREQAAEELDKTVKQRPEPTAAAQRTQSKFSELHAQLSTAEAIANFIRVNVEPLTTTPQLVHALMQAMSGRSDALYATLFDSHRAETLWLLDRVAGNATATIANAAGKRKKAAPAPKKAAAAAAAKLHQQDSNAISPYTHEFVFRAECGIVGQTANYADDVQPMAENIPLPVLTPRELISDFFVRDAVGYIERQLQLATSGAHVIAAAKRIVATCRMNPVKAFEGAFLLFDPEVSDASSTSRVLMQPTKASLLLGHLLSKARRLFGSLPAAASDATPTEGAKPPTAEQRSLTPEAVEALRPVVTTALRVCHKLCTATTREGKVEVPAKLQHFIDFAMSHELVGEEEVTWVEELLAAVTNGVESQADSMTAVLTIKTANTRAELRGALEAVATIEGDTVTITKPTPDVLSALGVAGTTLRAALKASPSAEGEELCKQLVVALTSCGVSLPRRATAFVDNERRIERMADVKRPRLAVENQADDALEQPAPAQPQPRRP